MASPSSAAIPPTHLVGAVAPIDWPKLLVELGIVVAVGLLLNSIGATNWTMYTLLFVAAILILNPTETIGFEQSLTKFVSGATQ